MIDFDSFGSWVDDYLFEFDPPIRLPPATPGGPDRIVRSFNLAQIADDIPGLVTLRDQLLEQLITEALPRQIHD